MLICIYFIYASPYAMCLWVKARRYFHKYVEIVAALFDNENICLWHKRIKRQTVDDFMECISLSLGVSTSNF